MYFSHSMFTVATDSLGIFTWKASMFERGVTEESGGEADERKEMRKLVGPAVYAAPAKNRQQHLSGAGPSHYL